MYRQVSIIADTQFHAVLTYKKLFRLLECALRGLEQSTVYLFGPKLKLGLLSVLESLRMLHVDSLSNYSHVIGTFEPPNLLMRTQGKSIEPIVTQ